MTSMPPAEFQKHFFKATIDLKQIFLCQILLDFNTSDKLWKFSLNLKVSPFLSYPHLRTAIYANVPSIFTLLYEAGRL